MNKAILFALPLFFLTAEEPVCKKCQMIREYNAAHPENNYQYYDDYIRDLEKKKAEGKDVTDAKDLGYHPK
jgi:hypothetical protein